MPNYIVQGSDLSSVASAIRTKGGTSAQLAFPAGFVQAIADIPTGGGGEWTTYGVLHKTEPSGTVVVDGYRPQDTILRNNTGITKIFFKNVNVSGTWDYEFANCTSLQYAILVNIRGYALSRPFFGDVNLLGFDGGTVGGISGNWFYECSKLATLVLRNDTIMPLTALNAFTNTPFASGNAGGNIYIPKLLYDHLGDGSSSDYKSATNWSTVDGYGTIAWHQIEGSAYETAYVDGTPIPTA